MATASADAVPPPDAVAAVRRTRQRQSQQSVLVGYCCLLVVIVCWVGAEEVFSGVRHNVKRVRPMLSTIATHAGAVVLLVMQTAYLLALGSSPVPVLFHNTSPRELLCTVATGAAVFLFADYTWVLSLERLERSTGCAMFNISTLAVLVLSARYLHEAITFRKVVAVLMVVCGAVFIAFYPAHHFGGGQSRGGNESHDHHTRLPEEVAYILSLASALLYAALAVLLKSKAERWGYARASLADQVVAANCITGLLSVCSITVGVVCLALLSAVPADAAPYLHEPFGFPDHDQTLQLVLRLVLGIAYQVFFVLGVVLLSPLLMSVGAVLSLPVNTSIQWTRMADSESPTAMAIVGFALVFVGFIALNDGVAAYVRSLAVHRTGYARVPGGGMMGEGTPLSGASMQQHPRHETCPPPSPPRVGAVGAG